MVALPATNVVVVSAAWRLAAGALELPLVLPRLEWKGRTVQTNGDTGRSRIPRLDMHNRADETFAAGCRCVVPDTTLPV